LKQINYLLQEIFTFSGLSKKFLYDLNFSIFLLSLSSLPIQPIFIAM